GRVHIRYWEKWTGFEEEAMRAVVDRFNRTQSRVFVDMLSVSQVDQKMLLATAGGDPPDVAGLWDYNVPVYADYNAIQALGSADAARSLPHDLCHEAGITAADYLPCYWDECVHHGLVYALPTTPA